MAHLTSAQHAEVGCELLDELLHLLESNGWNFSGTWPLQKKINEPAIALGVAAPFEEVVKPPRDGKYELWLGYRDPLTEQPRTRLIEVYTFVDGVGPKGAIHWPPARYPLSEAERAAFRGFVDRVKRALQRHAQLTGSQQMTTAPERAQSPVVAVHRKPAKALSKEARALAALADHPDWTDEQIAGAAGCNRQSLYRMKKFVAAKEVLRGGKRLMPKGSKNGETGDVEAWDDSGDDE